MIRKLLIASLMMASIDVFAWANSDAEVHAIQTRVKQATNLSHKFWYGIQNNTHFPQTYTITYTLCAANHPCKSETIRVDLASTKSISKNVYLPYTVSYKVTGTYAFTGKIEVKGESAHTNSKTTYITVLK